MADIHDAGQVDTVQANGTSETERLSMLVKQLQAECESLRQGLARSESERKLYLKAIHDYERAQLKDMDLDYDDLVKMSAGPVELVE
jgi:hypothetical protein